ncbi:MAG: DUF4197 domain-containing protein [Gammaproteobacteria bacterium]
MNRLKHPGLALAVAALVAAAPAAADWRDWLNKITSDEQTRGAVTDALSNSEIADGLRAALDKGVRNAVSQLGREDGFLADAKLRIPVPKHLEMVESGLRTLGKEELADQFVTSMNRAAERAVPASAEVFAGAISKMTIDDARAILDGGDTAATDYLRQTSHEDLRGRFRPIVDAAVRETDVTRRYQDMLDKAGPVAKLVDTDSLDLGNYVTDRALDGLYSVIGSEEQKIRANPAARTSELLKKVFGS